MTSPTSSRKSTRHTKNPGTRAGRSRNQRGQSFTYEDIQAQVEAQAAALLARARQGV